MTPPFAQRLLILSCCADCNCSFEKRFRSVVNLGDDPTHVVRQQGRKLDFLLVGLRFESWIVHCPGKRFLKSPAAVGRHAWRAKEWATYRLPDKNDLH